MSRETIIDVQGLNSHYGSRQVLFDIHCHIPRHEVTVIMGVSGCGKSTLLRHLIGLKPVSTGRVLIEGKNMLHFTPRELSSYRRRIGVLFQSSALFNSLTVAENIAVPLKVHTRLPQATIAIVAQIKLHLVGLSTFEHFMPSQLSGGMRKRAGLARALAMDPEILFVDEPSSGLDPITAAGLDELLVALRDALGMTIIVVTHELESAFRIANQMLVMDKGRILASGTAEEIQCSCDERILQFLQRQPSKELSDTEAYLATLLGKSA
jgi:phospholipid/cholesterol/gamma-HCH transport system ATP-binding protein